MKVICVACRGEGLDSNDEYCPHCGGSGVIESES